MVEGGFHFSLKRTLEEQRFSNNCAFSPRHMLPNHTAFNAFLFRLKAQSGVNHNQNVTRVFDETLMLVLRKIPNFFFCFAAPPLFSIHFPSK